MSENTPHNPSQGDSAAGGYGYDAGARPAQDASLTGQSAQAAQPVQPTQPTQQGAPAQGAQAQQPAGQPIPPVQGQPYPGAQPGQHGQPAQAVYAPAAPNPFVTALRSTLDAFLEVFAGKPGQANSRLAASGLWGWVIPNAIQSIVGAIFLTQLLVAVSTAAVYTLRALFAFGGASSSYSGPTVPFGRIILIFVVSLLAIFCVQVLRGVQIMLTSRIGKVPATFASSMHAVAVSTMALIPVYLVLNLLTLFMGSVRSADGAFFLTLLMVLLMSFAVFSGEALIYLGLNRLGRAAKSPVIMHALLSTAWVLAAFVVYYIAARMMSA